MTIEELYSFADSRHIDIDWIMFKHAESLSAPVGDNCVIAIDPSKLTSVCDEKTKLSHELGHCMTGSFYTPQDDFYIRQRFENRADHWAIKKLVPADELERAFKLCRNYFELAEYFDVTEDFIRKACKYYAKP